MFSRLITRTSPALSRPLRSSQLTRPLVFLPTRTLFETAMSTNTILQAVAEDHREMYTYYDEYVKASGDKAAQERWANQFMWEVARHAIGEEIVVYPLMEKHLGQKGKELADQDRTDHQYVKDRLYSLERTAVGTTEHASLLKDIIEHLRPHNDSEEQQDLPMLENVITREDSMKAAKSFSRTKKFVPTRSHPSAPNKPPFETLAGLMAAPMDKIKDMFAKFPSEEEKDAAMKSSSHN